jgi:hypothetical protein
MLNLVGPAVRNAYFILKIFGKGVLYNLLIIGPFGLLWLYYTAVTHGIFLYKLLRTSNNNYNGRWPLKKEKLDFLGFSGFSLVFSLLYYLDFWLVSSWLQTSWEAFLTVLFYEVLLAGIIGLAIFVAVQFREKFYLRWMRYIY